MDFNVELKKKFQNYKAYMETLKKISREKINDDIEMHIF